MTEPVIATKQVQCCVQVRVDLVYSVTNSFQSHPPVRGLRLLVVGGHMWETSAGERSQQENTGVAVEEHSPPLVLRLLGYLGLTLCFRTIVSIASQLSLLLVFNFISKVLRRDEPTSCGYARRFRV